jgi:hypothetical protein
MKAKDNKILRRIACSIEKRLSRNNFPDHEGAVMNTPNIHYKMPEKTRAIDCGAIGAFHKLCDNVNLLSKINACTCGNNKEKVESRTFTPAKCCTLSAFHFLSKCL